MRVRANEGWGLFEPNGRCRGRALRLTTAVALLTLFTTTENLAAKERLVALSPGKLDRSALIETRCPTFLWSGVSAGAYEIAVFRVAGDEEAREPVLLKSLPGPAFGWTPDAEECFERGGRYAWSVRASGDPGEWSEPFHFRIAAEPSEAEFRQALEVVERYLAGQQPANSMEPAGNPAADAGLARDGAEHAALPPSAATPINLNRSALMQVVGEIRSVDSLGQPRLWGRGRPGTVVYGKEGGGVCLKGATFYGLSHVAVDWGSAADACPAGTWVCREGEIDPCDTTRPDVGSADLLFCDGAGLAVPPGGHDGWLADLDGSVNTLNGRALNESSETGAQSNQTCQTKPVWCCWPPTLGLP